MPVEFEIGENRGKENAINIKKKIVDFFEFQ